jgi:hypothetical protein
MTSEYNTSLKYSRAEGDYAIVGFQQICVPILLHFHGLIKTTERDLSTTGDAFLSRRPVIAGDKDNAKVKGADFFVSL